MTAGLSAAILAVAIPLGMAWSSPARAADCPRATHPPRVTVTPLLPAPLEDLSTSYHDLTKESSRKLKPEEDAMGISSSRMGYSARAEFKVVRQGGQSCAYLAALDVQFGYTRRLVQIAREVPVQSCMYGKIREHEYKHVAVDDGILRDNFAAVTAQIRSFAAAYGPVATADAGAATTRLAAALKVVLAQTIRHLRELAAAAQAKVDTDAEYERVSAACHILVDPTAPVAPPPPPAPSWRPDGK